MEILSNPRIFDGVIAALYTAAAIRRAFIHDWNGVFYELFAAGIMLTIVLRK